MKRSIELIDMGEGERYQLLTGLVVPRPIGWIGTCSETGVANVAPCSFFNMVSGSPPAVLFSGGRRRAGERKDSVSNALATGEFTVNIVTADTVHAMNQTAASLPPSVDEFAHAGLTSSPGTMVAAPLVAEAAANLECRVFESVVVGTSTVVFGQVLVVHVDESVIDGHRIDPRRLRAIGRMAGRMYVETDTVFELTRPD